MQTLMISVLIWLGVVLNVNSTDPAKKDVIQVIESYVKAVDQQNVNSVNKFMEEDFRIIWHDGENPGYSLINKEVYLAKLSTKEWGGDPREIEVLGFSHFENSNATIQVKLKGKKATMYSFFSVVNKSGDWKIVQELVTARFN